MPDFHSGKDLLKLCRSKNKKISDVMREREIENGAWTEKEIKIKMDKVLSIMKNSAKTPLLKPEKSISGLTGGEAKKIAEFGKTKDSICDPFMNRVIAYSMAVLEVNASMGLIVAAPTAGSSGVIPGALLALQEEKDLADEEIERGLYCASAIGYLLMRNASVAGAEAGCQAEIGSASAMAAAAVTELMGGTPAMCLNAAGMALANMLGLVCDPVAGLVEIPCQNRNALGALNAVTCAQIVLSGVEFPIPFDEMADAMYRVGKNMPVELKETALGGCAATPTGCSLRCSSYEQVGAERK